MNVSFRATSIDYPYVIKRNSINNKENEYLTYFVELDTQNEEDYQALRKVAFDWENGGSYAMDVLNSYVFERKKLCTPTFANYRYFAFTTYDKPFTKIDPEMILGVATLIEKKDTPSTLQHLQVHPEHTYKSKNRGFRHIGAALTKTIQKLFTSNSLNLYSISDESTAFYKKMNFTQDKKSLYMIFKP